MKKKILCTIMSVSMAASLLAGCGSEPSDSGKDQADQETSADKDTPDDAGDEVTPDDTGTDEGEASDDPYAAYAGTTINVAAIETAYGSDMWKEVAEAFTAETGVEVELTTDKVLEDVIGPSMQGGEYPDVIHLATGRQAGGG